MTKEERAKHLGRAAFGIAINAARLYLEQHKLQASSDAILIEATRAAVNAKLAEAIQDAWDAFDCNMQAIGVLTFQASMINAGVEAAKAASQPIQ